MFFQRGMNFVAFPALLNAILRFLVPCSQWIACSWRDIQPCTTPISHLMFDYNFLHGCRVGEASNPGPAHTVSVCVINPTSLASKKDLLLSLDADIVALAETSATSFVQHEFSTALRDSPYSAWWGVPVDDKFKNHVFDHDRPSRRGEALGTAILSRLPTRCSRIADAGTLFQSGRFNACVCQFGPIEVLMISTYFFPGRTTEAQT